MTTKTIAEAVIKAANLHEDSYVDEGKCGYYKVSLQDASVTAANEIGEPAMAQPIYFWLTCTWNDILGWANDIMEKI